MNLLTNLALTTLKKLKCKIISSLNGDKNIFSVFYNLISRGLKAFLNFFYSWAQNYYKVFLLLIIIIGFFIRFPYIKSGLPYLNNSDEIHIAGRAIKSAYQYKKTYKETRTKAIEYVRDNFPNAKIGISKELKIHPYDLDKVQNKVLFNTEKVSLINLYEKNFDYIISSNKYFYYNVQKRTKYSHNLEELERKFPEQNIIKAFGDGSVVIDFLSKEPRINIYKVNKAFLNAKYIRKIQ